MVLFELVREIHKTRISTIMVFLNTSQSYLKKSLLVLNDFLDYLFSSGKVLEKVSRVREACHISHITSQ